MHDDRRDDHDCPDDDHGADDNDSRNDDDNRNDHHGGRHDDDSRHDDHSRNDDDCGRHDNDCGRHDDHRGDHDHDNGGSWDDHHRHDGGCAVHTAAAEASRNGTAPERALYSSEEDLGCSGHEQDVGVHAVVVPAPAISVPAVGIRAAIESNVSKSSLAAGAGHYPGTGWPGQGRTIGLAGHDVTYVPAAAGGHVFHRLIAAKVGERVYIHWRGRVFVYRITARHVVRPTDVAVLKDVGYERLVMTTCYPPGSASFRLVTVARRDATGNPRQWRASLDTVAALLHRLGRQLSP